MRLLLDSHVVAWLEFAVPGPPDLLADLTDPGIERVVSAVTPMEISTKVRRGRWEEARPLVTGWPQVMRRLLATPLAISHEHGLRAGSLDWDHRDPFDRLLVAQSQVENLTLVTADRAMLGAPGISIRPWT